jgi:hypothetical protein
MPTSEIHIKSYNHEHLVEYEALYVRCTVSQEFTICLITSINHNASFQADVRTTSLIPVKAAPLRCAAEMAAHVLTRRKP